MVGFKKVSKETTLVKMYYMSSKNMLFIIVCMYALKANLSL